jgi:membrane-associated phospholipid phosphatase
LLGTITSASLLVLGAALVIVAIARRRIGLGIAVGVAMVGAVLTTEILKRDILTRPDLGTFGEAGISANSFPSGHATIGMVLSLGAVMVAPVHLRRVAVVIAAVTSTAFGTAVLASGWHRPSDVIGAYLVALAWFAATSAAAERWRRHRPSGIESEPALSRPLLALAALGVLGFLMYVLWKSVNTIGLRTVVYAAPYVAAVIGIDVAGVAIVGLYYVIERTDSNHRSRVVA